MHKPTATASPTARGGREPPSDADLLRDYRTTRSEPAFTQIAARHGAMVFRTCLRQLGNVHEAEDAAQAAFVVLARCPEAVASCLASWLHGVARNTASKLVRSRTRRTRHEKEAAAMRSTVMESKSALELAEEVDAALGSLPVPLRQAVILHYLEGRSQAEAARLAGCPQGTLARRAMEGLDRLRAILHKRGVPAGAVALTGFLAQEASARGTVSNLLALKLAAAATVPSATAAVLAESILTAMFWAKIKTIALTAAAILLLLGTVPLGFYLTRAKDSRADETPTAAAGDEKPALPYRVAVRPAADEVITCPADTVVFSPNGMTLATGRCDGAVKLYDATTGLLKATLTGHSNRVRCVAFSPDGAMLASAGWDRTVRLWNIATGKEITSWKGHQAWVWTVAFSPDGKRVASGAWDGTVRIWEVGKRKEVATITAHPIRVNCVAFSADGRTLASGGADGAVKLWNAETGATAATLFREKGDVMSLAFAPDGRTLAAGGAGWRLVLWDVVSSRERVRLPRSEVTGLAFSADSRLLASTGLDQTTVLWDAVAGRETGRLQGDDTWGWSAAFSPDGQSLAVARGGAITLIDPGRMPKASSPD